MFKKIRRTKPEKEEIKADLVFLLFSFAVSLMVLYIFDIHWNFYPGGQLFPPAKHVFTDTSIYIWGSLLGSLTGLILIKLFLFGLREEETAWKSAKKRQLLVGSKK